MATITVTLEGVVPYDGRYAIDLAESQLTNREWGWIKRYSGYLPATLDDALSGGDAEFWCAFALILLRRAGRVTVDDAADAFELLEDAPYAAVAVKIEAGEDDAGPPPPSSNGNDASSGADSKPSSATPEPNLSPTGRPRSDTSVSVPATSAS